MASSFQKLKDLDLSRDEVERIGEALKKQEFRKLLADYVEEIQNPANKKLYEQEITQLEKERGVDVTFINPQPGYVIKTSVDGSKKCFINVCVNEHINKPTSSPTCREGAKGLQWSLPHSLTPPREDIDNKGIRCQVYDVVFHPDTLHMAHKNKAFYNMLNATACEAVESNFDVKLDNRNLKFPKLQYKGMPHASVIRKPSEDFVAQKMEPSEKEFFDKIYAQADANQSKFPKKTKKSPRKSAADDKSSYTTPNYVIKHRSHVDIQEFVEDKQAKMHAAIPKELIVEINLPLLKSSSDITLDVTEKTVQLISEKPSKYKLNLTLPYRVNQDNGNAKFDKDLKKLIIMLPVKRTLMDYTRDDSGVESDHGSPTTPESEEDFCEKDKVFGESGYRTNFLDGNCHYDLPEFTCHLFENILAFTLNVKNVDESSIRKTIEDSSLHIKFTSVSPSYYSAHYAFYVKLPSQTVIEDGVQVETWDNNVIVQIPFNCDNELKYYFYGLNDLDLKQKFLEEPSVLNSVLQNTIPEESELEISPKSDEINEETTEISNVTEKSTAINISGTSYESSGDELSCSFSPSKSKGILKRLSSNRYFVGRSISESSLDDIVCSSVDSAIPEDGEISTSLKKTVRFNDVIMRQLYRSNSSILGQKKKNQRKARNKKRAQERRHSESEASELEDKKEDETKELSDNQKEESSDCKEHEKNDYIASDIFDMDMSF
ncbi:kintoun [Asbolus verrucosus]|uniref:Protein kintoun n=1 Tax=Asbolus verrucosus TaxID=1661398 RepID=A0A482W9Q3_ASBVE|nr:kintoun [Asbolus verrucosus]